MATNNIINVGLSGASGTGSFAGTTSPVLVTPTLGVATGTSLNFGASATNGLIGVTGGTDAAAGVVGELITSTVGNVSLAVSTTVYNLTSLSLTAGDWLVFGTAVYSSGGVASDWFGSVSLTSATTGSYYFQISPGSTNWSQLVPILRVSIAATTIVYLTSGAIYAAGVPSARGTITAIRQR